MKKALSILFAFCMLGLQAQDVNFSEEELQINKFTEGTLTTPLSGSESLVIFIQGSGPTDRDGNQSMMKNDGMKKMSRELAENGIASFRFDKRIFQMNKLKIKEEDLRFEHFVEDVEEILKYFKASDQYENLIIAGHSQGSLVGMIAAKKNADAFISLAGAGEPIDNIITDQIKKMAPPLAENARTAFEEMKTNGKTTNYSPMLQTIFKPSVQPFMNSWIQYDPAQEIAQLDIPVLIINGTADIQVEEEQAKKLANAKADAQLKIIQDMNHIFREIKSKDQLVNTKSYNEPNLPLHPELIEAITTFIKEVE
ncbi:alpha/beta hydrolase [Christiangramia aquimixticola]|uniref:alpha/beta hydrolase n=1 Tax=Christiangramia aquimixticola TaxID=1697558 RepID=UPI003AA837AD